MSVLDAFDVSLPNLEEVEDQADEGLMALQATFAEEPVSLELPGAELPGAHGLGEAAGSMPEPACDAELLRPVDASRPKKRARRRPGHGPGAKAQAAPVEQTRSQICSAAAKARWARRRQQLEAPEPETSAVEETTLAVRPVITTDLVPANAFPGHETSTVLMKFDAPINPDMRREEEKYLHKTSGKLISWSALASHLGIHRDTVQRKLRLIAAITVLGARYRALHCVKRLDHFLKVHCGFAKAALHAVSPTYDEVQMKLRVSELRPEDAEALKRIGMDAMQTKLMQVNVRCAALWETDKGPLQLLYSLPSLLKPIESTHANVVQHTVLDQSRVDPWIKENFEARARVPGNDDHPSNGLADLHTWASDQEESLIRFICKQHKGHKIAELSWSVFSGDQSGLLNCTLCHAYPGSHRDFLEGIMWWFERRLLIHDFGQDGAGDEAAAYRKKIEDTFGYGEDERLSGPAARKRQRQKLNRRRLLNGRVQLIENPEHFCKGPPTCCRDRKHTIHRIRSEVVEEIERPQAFASNRWLGSEQSQCTIGFWGNTHALYIIGVLVGWCKLKDEDEIIRQVTIILMSVPFADEVAGVNYVEATPDMTRFERQTTYIENVKRWFVTRPFGRLWVLKFACLAQQNQQKQMLRAAGAAWEAEQARASAAGKQRQYRVLLALDQEISGPCMRAFGELLTTTERWRSLPDQYKSHHIAADGYRCGSRAACAEYDLFIIDESTYPCPGLRAHAPRCEESRSLHGQDRFRLQKPALRHGC